MRLIIWTCLALGVLWGGYWFVGSTAVERGVAQWFTDQAALGLTATQSDISVSGFPNRFDLTVTDPHLADPTTGWGWKAPFVQVFAMTWKPWHLIAALPHDQVIEAPGQSITLTSSKLEGSVRFTPDTSFALQRAVVEGHDLMASSDLGWTLGVQSLILAVQHDPTRANAQHLGLNAQNLTPDPALAAALPALGPSMAEAYLDATLERTAPQDDTSPQITALTVTDFHLTWGSLHLSAKGQIAPGANGLAEGVIDLQVQDWQQIPAILVATGIAQPAMGQAIKGGLEALAKDGKDPKTLDLPLSFNKGWMSLGPIPLGPAPLLAPPVLAN
jgi:hypothetical protein